MLIPQQPLPFTSTTLLSNVYLTLSITLKIIILLIYLLLDTFNLEYSPGHHLTIYLHPLNLTFDFQHKRNHGYKLRYLCYPSSPPTIDLHLIDFQIIHPIQPLQQLLHLHIEPIIALQLIHQHPTYQSTLNE